MAGTATLEVCSQWNYWRRASATLRIENYLASFVEAKKIELFLAIRANRVAILMIRSNVRGTPINRKTMVESTVADQRRENPFRERPPFDLRKTVRSRRENTTIAFALFLRPNDRPLEV
jgi:hypothetical protein